MTSQRRQGLSSLLLGLAALAWLWSRNPNSVAWYVSESLLAILAPVFCLMGMRMVFARAPVAERGLEFWANPTALFAIVLGFANAYALGVWRIVSIEGLRELAPLIVITGLVGGAKAALSIWKRRRGSRDDD